MIPIFRQKIIQSKPLKWLKSRGYELQPITRLKSGVDLMGFGLTMWASV
jgi:hypothetical protein